MIGRTNLATALLDASGAYGGKLGPASIAKRYGHTDARSVQRFLVDLFIQPDHAHGVAEALAKRTPTQGPLSHRMRQFADTVVTLPEFHLA